MGWTSDHSALHSPASAASVPASPPVEVPPVEVPPVEVPPVEVPPVELPPVEVPPVEVPPVEVPPVEVPPVESPTAAMAPLQLAASAARTAENTIRNVRMPASLRARARPRGSGAASRRITVNPLTKKCTTPRFHAYRAEKQTVNERYVTPRRAPA